MKFAEYIKQDLNENQVKLQALEEMKQIQTTLGSISFLSVIAVMREDNPLKPQIHDFENKLHELTVEVSKFINDNLKDAVEVTDDERASNVDKAVKDAEDEATIAKKSPQNEAKKIENLNDKYIVFQDGSMTSLDSDSAVIVSNGDGNAKIYLYRAKIYMDTNRYEKYFKSMDELVKYLNKENYEYIGIDDI